MKQLYSNSTVYWNEQEIERRESLIRQIYLILKNTWSELNPAVKFHRVETPILTPADYLRGHTEKGFPLIKTNFSYNFRAGYLRPEIAGGCFAAFIDMWPQKAQRDKLLPICIWQAGKSFRTEDKPDTMRATKLRLSEFWQLEFELICREDTKADYICAGIDAIRNEFYWQLRDSKEEIPCVIIKADDLPHYSSETWDWMCGDLELAGCSVRTDLEGYMVHEISIGLDRLLAVL